MTAAPATGEGVQWQGTSLVRTLRIVISVVAWGALVVFTLLSVGGPLIGSGTFLGTEVFRVLPPWTSALGQVLPITNGMIGDTIDTVTPQAWSIVEAAKQGVFASWNPWVGGGTELGALPNSGVYSPASIAWWVLPLEAAPGATKVVEIAVSSLGMSLLLRRLGAPNAAWAIASLLYVSSGFMVAWTNWPQTRVAAFVPLLFWALDRAAVRRRIRDAVPIGIALASMFLGGFPAIVGYALYAGGVYVLVRALTAQRDVLLLLRSVLVSAAGVVLGVLLAAVVLIPFAVNASSVLDFSVRQQTPENHLQFTDIATALTSEFVGVGASGVSWGDGSPIERLSYIGVAGVLLIVAALLTVPRSGGRRAVLWYFIIGLALCSVLIFVGGPLLAAAQQLPIFSNNPVGRLRVMLGFFAAVAAGLGFAALGTRLWPESAVEPAVPESTAATWRRRVLASVAAGTIVVVAALAVREAYGLVPSEYVEAVRAAGGAAAVVGAITVVCMLLGRLGRSRVLRFSALSALPVLVAVPAVSLADTWWPVSPTSTVYASTPALDYLGDHLGHERYVSVDQAGFPGSNAMYRLRSVDGHAYQTSQWKELLTEVDPDMLLTPTFSTLPSARLGTSLSSPILDRLGVAYVLMGPDVNVPGPVTEELAGGGSLELEPGAPLRSGIRTGPVRALTVLFDGARAPVGEVTLTTDIVDATTGQLIASTSTWYPALAGARQVAVEGDDIDASTSWYAVLSIDRGGAALLASGVDPAVPAVSTTAPTDDGLTVVHTGDATVLHRASALPRIRWASEALVESDSEARRALLADPALPGSTVVLEQESDASGVGRAEAVDPRRPDDAAPQEGLTTEGAGESGATTAVRRVDDDGSSGRIRVRTSAEEPGWLVFDDSLRRPGWSATVDGKPAELIDAEHAGGAVVVPAGRHTVELVYTAPGLKFGAIISVATAALVAVLLLGAILVRQRRSPRDSGIDDPGSGAALPTTEDGPDAQTTGV